MGTVTCTMVVSVDGAPDTPHVFPGLSADEGRRLGAHFIDQALHKVMAMMPDPDDKSGAGDKTVLFDFSTTRDSDGSRMGGQKNDWPGLNDQTVAALKGVFDTGMAKLDRQIAGKEKHGNKGHGKP